MKKKAKKAMEKPTMEIMTPARSEELELRHINDRSMINNLVHENICLCNRVREREKEIEKLHIAERERLEKKKAAWQFAGKMGLMLLFSAFCAVSAAGCSVYGPWWTMVAPIVLFMGGLWTWLRWI